MYYIYKCPNGHIVSQEVTEYSPDINCTMLEESDCEECGIPFDDKTWKFLTIEYDEYDED